MVYGLWFIVKTTTNHKLLTYLGLKTKKGTIISSIEIPPCW
jgi:hypothetical protein